MSIEKYKPTSWREKFFAGLLVAGVSFAGLWLLVDVIGWGGIAGLLLVLWANNMQVSLFSK